MAPGGVARLVGGMHLCSASSFPGRFPRAQGMAPATNLSSFVRCLKTNTMVEVIHSSRSRSFIQYAIAELSDKGSMSQSLCIKLGRRNLQLLLPSVSIFLSWDYALAAEGEDAGKGTIAPEAVEGKKNGGRPVESILSVFERDELAKSGSRLPKAYLQSAREVVKTLRESLSEDPVDDLKFRRSAEAAKGAIRGYMGRWKGASEVVQEGSYAALESALRELGKFYAAKGPRAAMPETVRDKVLGLLAQAEDLL
eukprot:TRINITY_DN5676_c0_g1_i1.p1 TRINITY_DN5676_c0_g1~~TRINITY_DN5676_c0_g1_i1.p1  ORF type:complete len:253 (+),score=54.09 TRINITY_DN5676_c0_g1_i1:78-836(+)